MKKYKVIYADPPWTYTSRSKQNQRWGCAVDHYPTMTINEICELPIREIADGDCALFLWITMPNLPYLFDVLKAWGFNYKTVAFVWVKRNRKADSWFFGLGNWTRANAELCVLATKGRPKRQSNRVPQIIDTHVEKHSQKPAIARERIVELMGNLPRIELFAREVPEGWDVWGNEVVSSISFQPSKCTRRTSCT